MSLKQRMVAVFMLVAGSALAAGLLVGAFRVNATSDDESAEGSAAVDQNVSTVLVTLS
jgi:hypothetical protein